MLLAYVAYRWADPTPPSRVTLSTGQDNSAYAQFGQIYADALQARRIKVVQRVSLGSQDNLERLNDDGSQVDIGFVQSGSTQEEEAEREGLISLGSLFVEPVWIFYRGKSDMTQLAQFRGKKVNIGGEGSGVPRLFRQLLKINNIEPNELTPGYLADTPATVALLDGKIDALVFSSAPEAPLIQMLLQTPGIRLFDFVQAEAYTRRLPYLTHVVLPRGIVDLGRDLPAHDIHLIAPTATLVAREDIHPALIELFVQAASKVHGGAGWFRREGEFPSARYTEVPVAAAATRFYQHGAPFLERYLPFGLANFLDRMWVFIVALGALLLPLSKVVQPLYVWRIRSRVYRWYGELRIIEQALEHEQDGAAAGQASRDYGAELQQLAELEEKVNQISVPLSFADGLYDLRAHIHLVREQVRRMQERLAPNQLGTAQLTPDQLAPDQLAPDQLAPDGANK
jgi:TRAP transporter TAXI family solute receptor